jgi:hypothetical protein
VIAGLDIKEIVELALLLIATGALSGFLAGVFGIGGGAILVPVFYECFRIAGVPLEVRMPLCIGTSLAVIIPTSIRSFQAHYKRGAVDMSSSRVTRRRSCSRSCSSASPIPRRRVSSSRARVGSSATICPKAR